MKCSLCKTPLQERTAVVVSVIGREISTASFHHHCLATILGGPKAKAALVDAVVRAVWTQESLPEFGLEKA